MLLWLLQSGLICLDWYDWNILDLPQSFIILPSRDWSVWIDTIETQVLLWEQSSIHSHVGIDLFGLIRLKPWTSPSTLYAFAILVRIDLFGLIRLKHKCSLIGPHCFDRSGLICLDWYDWNICRGWLYHIEFCQVRIDLFGLIRLKQIPQFIADSASEGSGLICLNRYDWNDISRIPHSLWNNIVIDLYGLIRLKIIKGTAIEIPQ